MLVCPNEIVAKSASVTLSTGFTIPFASPGRSTPLTFPKPNLLIYSQSFSLPIICPSCINATLHEFLIISGNV